LNLFLYSLAVDFSQRQFVQRRLALVTFISCSSKFAGNVAEAKFLAILISRRLKPTAMKTLYPSIKTDGNE
jgi:hypothetical protein